MKRFNAIAASLFLLFAVVATGCEVTVTVDEDSCLGVCPEGTQCIDAECVEVVVVVECDPACEAGSTCIEGMCIADEPAGMGTLTLTNDIDWSDVQTNIVSVDVTAGDWSVTTTDSGIEMGVSFAEVPAGDYTVTVMDDMDVSYVMTPVPVEADSETELSVMIVYATSGAINLTNAIDNLDGDEVFVVGLYATNPDENVVDLADDRNWLEGAQVGYEQSAVAIGVPVGSYQLILKDMDDNYYLKTDIVVDAGAVTDTTVTTDDRDEGLTLTLN
ncbi:MAG: hypothetical protein ACPGU1_06605 [Myxococcota bacterium]